jgi:hydroxymethylpyrimidine/phosphomethylpyrimidine kinase
MPATLSPPVVLTFAATDPTGGAGLQADLLTLAALGCHPLSVVTAVTVQDTAGIEAIHALDSEWLMAQASTVLADMPVRAFKIGCVGSAANVAAIAAILAAHPDVPVVLDPVLASGRGDEMTNQNALTALRERLLPRATLLTPNSGEARSLASRNGDGSSLALSECAQRLVALGCGSVLITGTHENTPQVINTLYSERGEVRTDRWPRLPGSYHGSGCTLASACAALLASGKILVEAVREAQDFTWHTLASAFEPGRGQYIPDRFFRQHLEVRPTAAGAGGKE